MIPKQITTTPAHLFVGSENQLHQTILYKLQDIFCTQQPTIHGCFCSQCRKLKQEQHPHVIWIEPEKKYLVSDLDIIFEKIKFSLEPNESFFFILQKAHHLTPVCANKLLKTLEEPPPGYFFFLLTNNEQAILPTIRSRSLIHHIQTDAKTFLMHPIISFFIDQKKLSDPFSFDQELKKQTITEEETMSLMYDLLDSIEKRIIEYEKKCTRHEEIEHLKGNTHYKRLQETFFYLQRHIQKPPQPGSANLFWKKLFLTFPRK